MVKDIIEIAQDVFKAYINIKQGPDGIKTTPLDPASKQITDILDIDLYFKKEFVLPTGSFKERGARNALLNLTSKQKKKGVICASAGNHGSAISYQCKLLDISATIVTPVNAPITKINNCKKYNSTIIQHGKHVCESKQYALSIAEKQNFVYINGYDDDSIIAGAGTIGMEILEQLVNIDVCIIPIGGGGLIAGLAPVLLTYNPHIKIIGVEPHSCPSWSQSLIQNKVVDIQDNMKPTIADGCAVSKIGENSFSIASHLIHKIIIVSEEDIKKAIRYLLEYENLIIEGAGAIGFASLLSDKDFVDSLKGKRVVTLLTGSNIDITRLNQCL